jgi:hypothetical protein
MHFRELCSETHHSEKQNIKRTLNWTEDTEPDGSNDSRFVRMYTDNYSDLTQGTQITVRYILHYNNVV